MEYGNFVGEGFKIGLEDSFAGISGGSLGQGVSDNGGIMADMLSQLELINGNTQSMDGSTNNFNISTTDNQLVRDLQLLNVGIG